MPQYLLLLYDDAKKWEEVRRTLPPQEIQKLYGKYMAFRQMLVDKKIYLGSHKLADEPGRVLRAKDGRVITSDGPYSETKEWLGGYFLIEAPNYDAAVEISRACPSLEHGGTVEVREVDPLTPLVHQKAG